MNARTLVVSLVLGAFVAWLSFFHDPRPREVLAVEAFLAAEHLPGAVIAFGRAGGRPQLVALGTREPGSTLPLRADARLPLGSLSKPITAAAVYALVSAGRLHLDERIVDILPEVAQAADTRMRDISVRHLLQHEGGWDRTQSFDPVYAPASFYGDRAPPADCTQTARDMLAQPLQFAPGTRQAYSNLGYCWLAAVISARSGMPYTDYVQQAVLAPARLDGIRPGEGGLARLGPAGGWTGTAADYFRLAAQPTPAQVAMQPASLAPGADGYIGGWHAYPGSDGRTLAHAGFMQGQFALVARFPDDRVVVVLATGGVRDGMGAFHRLFAALRNAGA